MFFITNRLFTCIIVLICNEVISISSYKHHLTKTAKQKNHLIKLENGLIQGKIEKVLDTNVVSYLGIPYAEPPLGQLRFKPPQPLKSNYTDDIYNATYFRSACMQKNEDESNEKLGGVEFSEDCLHLNIWIPQGKPSRSYLKPVLFYTFASGFHKSSPARPSNRGEFLSAIGDIIVVTPNYRLGFLGFACCGENYLAEGDDIDLPGNLGLRDLKLALTWTRDNIRHFGGDPESITVSGASAGGILSMMLTLSPKVPRSWFHNVFVMSGVPANGATIDSIDVALDKTRFIAEQVGCSTSIANDSSLQLMTNDEIECLRYANLTAILELQDSDLTTSIGNSIKNGIFGVYGDQLIPESPELSLASRKLSSPTHKSFVIGNVQNEGSWIDDYWPENKSEAINFLTSKLGTMLKTDNQETLKEINKTIDIYFHNVGEQDQFKIRNAMNDLYSDWIFKCPSLYFAEKLALHKNLAHIYKFDYVPKTYIKADGTSERPFGTLHGDDQLMFLGQPYRDPYNYNHHDRWVSKNLMQIYADFVKDRRLPWPPVLTAGKRVEPLRWKITSSLDTKNVDVVHLTGHCQRLNKLRNHKFFEDLSNEVMDNVEVENA